MNKNFYMQSRRIKNKIIVRIDKGEELVESIMTLCKEHGITLGSISGIGATNKVTIGLFDVETKKYHSKEFTGNFEIAPLTGNISTMDNALYLHLHINICDANHNSFGGHLNSAIISATFEGIIDVIDYKVDRIFNDETGLNLLKFDN